MSEKIEKHFSYEAKTRKKYKINAANFLGNFGDNYGYLFTVSSHDGEFEFMVCVPRSIMLKKWKLPNRAAEESALVQLGLALIKRELDRSNEQNGYKILFNDSMAKENLHKTLHSLE